MRAPTPSRAGAAPLSIAGVEAEVVDRSRVSPAGRHDQVALDTGDHEPPVCEQLARSAAHAAMAGKTDVMVGAWHNEFVHVPLGASVRGKKRIAPEDDIWATVLAVTGQEKW